MYIGTRWFDIIINNTLHMNMGLNNILYTKKLYIIRVYMMYMTFHSKDFFFVQRKNKLSCYHSYNSCALLTSIQFSRDSGSIYRYNIKKKHFLNIHGKHTHRGKIKKIVYLRQSRSYWRHRRNCCWATPAKKKNVAPPYTECIYK